ncbi:MAG: hypothetical protein Q7O66_01175 [Dehalococcoidia bacterium]|nr:hypothetical protein [Dehalococcoidia bacterium]
MELKNGEIFQMGQLCGELAEVDVPARVGYHVGRLIKKVQSAGKDIDETRNKLIAKYGEKNDKGLPQVKPDSPNFETFAEEYNGLMDEKTDIDANKVILPAETKIKIKLLMAFDPFLEVTEA